MVEEKRSIKVAVVCPWFYRGDAVGAAARETYIRLSQQPDMEVQALWTVNDYDDVRGQKVDGISDLLLDPIFISADIIIYIFAVYHEFFDAMLIGNGRARQIVRFHNVTPKQFMPKKHWPVIERSFVQIQNFSEADELWADSRENLEELERRELGGARVRIIPLTVEPVTRGRLADKPIDTIEMMYVGRFFQSKGVLELIEAADLLRSSEGPPFRLRLYGNLRFSDEDYVAQVRHAIETRGLDEHVELVGSVSPRELAAAFQRAHIYATGSRHEGFCVPVIEGLAAGCVPVSYKLSNLRFIAAGLGRLANSDTPQSLAEALRLISNGLVAGILPLDRGDRAIQAFDIEANEYIREFEPDVFSERISARIRTLIDVD